MRHYLARWSFTSYILTPLYCYVFFFFFNDTATTEIYTLSLHDALPILFPPPPRDQCKSEGVGDHPRSEEHTSELQSLRHLVCRLLLEKKKKKQQHRHSLPPTYSDQHAHVLANMI